MAATVNVNARTVVHKGSAGVSTAFPDTCLTPTPSGSPVPVPYPNVAQSSDAADTSKDVTIDGVPVMLKSSRFARSTGDEAGVALGVVSGRIQGAAQFVNYSFDVCIEGQEVPRLGDLMTQNMGSPANTPPIPEVQPPTVADAVPDPLDEVDTSEVEIASLAPVEV